MSGTAGLRGSPGYLPATFVFSALLLAGPRPAAAQTDLLMVVCVGSELEDVMGANQVPQTFRRDEEMGYITDVDPAYREEAEQAVREHLAGYARVWCEWSGAGDSHVVVVRFYGRMLQLRWGEVEEDADRPEVPRPEPEGLFRDCGACPGMVVVPAGTFPMGAPDSEAGRSGSEGPLRPVTIGAPFAVGAYEVTFAEWDACVLAGGCGGVEPDDLGLGRERRPVFNVTWDEVQGYLAWLSAETGDPCGRGRVTV